MKINIFRIYDTKYIAKYSEFSNHFEEKNSLSDLLDIFFFSEKSDNFKKTELRIPPGFEDYKLKINPELIDKNSDLTNSRYHEAGYDAFITGICFLIFKENLGEKNLEANFANHLNLMNTFWNVNFGGKDLFKFNVIHRN